MEAWSGSITLDLSEGASLIEDVQLHASIDTSILRIESGVRLHFLALVDPAAIPLHLVAGSRLGVFTKNPLTEAWFSENIVDHCPPDSHDGDLEAPWWTLQHGQSSAGLLVRVDGDMTAAQHGQKVSELLIYAAMPQDIQHTGKGILTPPRSSSPPTHSNLPENGAIDQIQARLYALPLSSAQGYNVADFQRPQSPPADNLADGFGRFLQCGTVDARHNRSSDRKRQRLESLFEDAKVQNKRIKRRGGENVAKAVATLDTARSANRDSPAVATLNADNCSQESPIIAPSRPPHPRKLGIIRTHSLGSIRDLEHTRPCSRGSIGGLKRSSLHHVSSVATLESSSPAPEAINAIEQQNKTALTRLVMAGMRMYGLQQRKKKIHVRSTSEISIDKVLEARPTLAVEPEDEYKLVYHQTYKAASFVLRRQMASSPIGQEVMRDVVDQLLELFCVDPLRKLEDVDMEQKSFGSEIQADQSLFDSPSGDKDTQRLVAFHITPRKGIVEKLAHG